MTDTNELADPNMLNELESLIDSAECALSNERDAFSVSVDTVRAFIDIARKYSNHDEYGLKLLEQSLNEETTPSIILDNEELETIIGCKEDISDWIDEKRNQQTAEFELAKAATTPITLEPQ